MEKICEAVNTAPAKRSAPAPPQDQPAPKQVQTGSHLICHHDDNDDDEPPALEDVSDDEEEDKDEVNK